MESSGPAAASTINSFGNNMGMAGRILVFLSVFVVLAAAGPLDSMQERTADVLDYV